MNSKNNLLTDMFSGMAGHPGFANIVASVVQEKFKTSALNPSEINLVLKSL